MESGCFTNTKHIEITGNTYLNSILFLSPVLSDHIKILVGKLHPHPRKNRLTDGCTDYSLTQEPKASPYSLGSGGGSQGDTATHLQASAWG